MARADHGRHSAISATSVKLSTIVWDLDTVLDFGGFAAPTTPVGAYTGQTLVATQFAGIPLRSGSDEQMFGAE
jgi:hypothetical protein